MDTQSVVNIIIAVVGSGGFLGGIYALLKLRPEAGQITVTAAQGAILVQTGVIDTLREELIRVRAELHAVEKENEALRAANKELRDKLLELEQRMDRHKQRLEEIEKGTS